MIRYAYVNNQILNIYSKLSNLTFPLDVQQVINLVPNCKFMSYQQFAQINNCSISDVIQICESKSGCTHYDISQNKYLILCNQSTDNNNNIARQRWTCGHEFAHVVCKHLELSAYNKLSENNLNKDTNYEFELEADYFAATLLSPFPLFKLLNINSNIDIEKIFGLSKEASIYRYNQYKKWIKSRVKTSWENDIIKIYKIKNNLY